jgi:mono/diheme cytochrome c family protein
MKLPAIPIRRLHMISGAALLAASCAPQAAVEKHDDRTASFAKVKPVLERNCVHCHASNRLEGMPPLNDTQALAGLIGPGNWIVPGKPEQSRFYVVATLSDDQAGAMPPTGHALSPDDTNILREWIRNGTPLPEENVKLVPKGTSPRSR